MQLRPPCAAVLLCLAANGCALDPITEPPLGMTLAEDGVIYAGAAVIDITPDIGETFTDLNDNHDFDGCLDDPDASGEDCDEPFDDANDNGWFDPVWIGGFGPGRPALGVHDPIYARALVLSFNGEYLALVSLDVVGVNSPRIHQARDRLVADGFLQNRLLVASTHNHQGPDTMGLWGDPEAFVSGLNPDYQERIAQAMEEVVRRAATDMQPVTLQVGAVRMRDVSPKWFNGVNYGGKNPSAIMHGMIYDGRDPVVVSDQLLVMQGVGADDSVSFTLTNWSGHPEVRSSSNNQISSDWVGVTREVLEARFGGVAIHLPESLGGMQSALSGDVPLIDEDGVPVFQICDAQAVADPEDGDCYGQTEGDPRIDDDGDEVPVWAEHDSWAFVHSHGWHIAEAATDALADGTTHTEAPIRVEVEPMPVPLENTVYLMFSSPITNIFELGVENAIEDPERCPELHTGDAPKGCLLTNTFRLQVGPVGFTAVPGELLPEVAWGLPEDDPRWQAEVADPTARGPGAVYFRQHDPDCNDLDYVDCTTEMSIGECDCLHIHAWPYVISPDPAQPPLMDAWDDTDVEYRAVIGMADNYLSYIIPEPDFNREVSLLTDDGDHYEDTVSPAHNFATRLQEAQARIDERW